MYVKFTLSIILNNISYTLFELSYCEVFYHLLVYVLNDPHTNRHLKDVIGGCCKVTWVTLTCIFPVRNYFNAVFLYYHCVKKENNTRTKNNVHKEYDKISISITSIWHLNSHHYKRKYNIYKYILKSISKFKNAQV